ncbi:MAG: Gfo/Idh/MocA family oxidoreductase [Opitutales bacterium]
MSKHKTGFDYVPDGEFKSVIPEGSLKFASVGLDHGHIFAMSQGLINVGAECKLVWDSDPKKVEDFLKRFPNTKAASSLEEVLADEEIKLIANASVPADRFSYAKLALENGKHFFVDKPAFTSLEQLEEAEVLTEKYGKKLQVYFAERLHNEAAQKANMLIKEGRIGDVLQVMILAPHRLSKAARPAWFFEKARYGGILCDIGTHQFEQFLEFGNCEKAHLNFARVDNLNNPETPELEDFGEVSITLANGVSCYCRVDWFTPEGLPVWGDGRTFILGTKGYIEIKKYIDISKEDYPAQTLFLVDDNGVERMNCRGMNFSFFEEFALDIVNNTDKAMSQEHNFNASRLALEAQVQADKTRTKK